MTTPVRGALNFGLLAFAPMVPLANADDGYNDCTGLLGPFLVTEEGIPPTNWPTRLNYEMVSLATYMSCRSNDEAAGDMEGFVPGSPKGPAMDFEPALNLDEIPPAAVPTLTPWVSATTAASYWTIYSMPSYGDKSPKGKCMGGSMTDTVKAIQKQTYAEIYWACLGDSWTYQSGGNWDYRNSYGDPREAAEDHFTNNLSLNAAGNLGLAWLNHYEDNGVAAGTVMALGADHCNWNCAEWSHRAIAMHEVGHLLGANDNGAACHPGEGIMNYCGAYQGKMWFDKTNLRRVCATLGSCGVA